MAIVRSGQSAQHTDPSVQPRLRARRSTVLACLQGAQEAVSVADVAERTGLHVNTARFHLDALVEDRLAQRRTEKAAVPGRPRVLYFADGQDVGPRSYRLMADMLMGVVAALDPHGSAAAATGRAWGHRLAAETAEESGQAALARLVDVLDGVGFGQTRHEGPDGPEMRIHHCPFIELARQRPDVVCTLHLGLLRGAAEELDAPVDVMDLRPFARPGLCIATLRDRVGADPQSST
jgi:predicted ArsR family transcriptional regulator